MTIKADNSSDTAGEEATEAVEKQSYVERRAAELRASRKISQVEAPGAKPKIIEAKPTDPEVELPGEPSETEEEEVEEPARETNNDALDLSQIDYEQLDADSAEELGRQLSELLGANIAAFSKGAGSGLGRDISELRAKAREAEAERDKIANSLEKLAPHSNRFSDVKEEAKLDEIESSLVNLYDTYSSMAIRGEWESNDDGDEGIYDQGKFYPKGEMLKFLDQWKADLREIPKQRNYLNKSKESRKSRDKLAKKLNDTYEWFGDSESEQAKSYSELMSDSSVAGAIHIFPDLEPILMEAFAAKVSGGKKPAGRPTLPLRSRGTPSSGDNGAAASGSQKGKGAARGAQSGQSTVSNYLQQRAEAYSTFFNKSNH